MKTLRLLFASISIVSSLAACNGDWMGSETPSNQVDTLSSAKPAILRDGTREHPFLPGDFVPGSDILQYYSGSADEVWVEGYIVGYVNGSRISSVVYEAGDKESNIVIGDDDTSPTSLFPVQLSESSEVTKTVRAALNLVDNPSNLGRHVKVAGTIDSYMSSYGLKPATGYDWIE